MTDKSFIALAALAIAAIVLLLVLIFRKGRLETPADLAARLTLLEQNVLGLVQSAARGQGSTDRIEQQLIRFTETMTAGFRQASQTLEAQLSKTVEESRNGRAELTSAFSRFEGKLEQRLTTVESSISSRLAEFQKSTVDGLQASRKAVDERLAQTLEESRNGRKEIMEAFDGFEGKLEQRIGAFDTSLTNRFEVFQASLSTRLEEIGKTLFAHLEQGKADSAAARGELNQTLTAFRTEITTTLATLASETIRVRETMAESAAGFETRIQERFEVLTLATRTTLDSLKADITATLGVMSTAMKDQLDANGNQIRNQFATLQESVAQKLTTMAEGSHQSSEQLRTAMNERLAAIQQDNTTKLEEMRRTVDEKLHATLEQRLGESFKLVSERLEQVHAGLGEMKTLAGSVGDLKRVMTNVRARGTWGEVQLGSIIESMLTVEQFAKNVKTAPNSNDLVEYAIRMPGKSEETPIWLPIDSKYPVEHYQRLMDAHDTLDKLVIQQMTAAFEASIRLEAKKISSKYLSPPGTTDFAILFLATEGLFAEVARVPGLIEALQNDHRVVVSGPTTLAALLNSLRLGFRTLAIEKRSSEVWGILGTVKTEFKKFGEIVESTKKSLDAASKKFDEVGIRTRSIQRSLRVVDELPTPESAALLTSAPALLLRDEDDDHFGFAGVALADTL